MRFLSVCSGIEAASVAWNPLGWKAAAFAEIEPFPCAVLAHHYPTVPNWGDMTKYQEWPLVSIDLLCGGTPCQSFSVAGLRKGLADPRGNLMLTFGAIAAKYRPRWLVWENVPGVLSSNGGRDFGAFLGMLGQLGYGFAYRVLDAQYFGVAQRRRRVFVVGCLGDWRSAAAVLLERHSLSGHPAPSRQAGQGATPCLASGAEGSTGAGIGRAGDPMFTLDTTGAHSVAFAATDYESGAFGQVDAAAPLTTSADRTRAAPILAFSAKDYGGDASEDLAPTLRAGGHADSHANAGVMPAIAFNMHKSGNEASSLGISEGKTDCLRAFDKSPFAVQSSPGMQVRRLTPRECERLQGFPDDYTLIPLQNKKPSDVLRFAADGPRYKALGNSWAVPCARWIGERIEQVEAIAQQREAA